MACGAAVLVEMLCMKGCDEGSVAIDFLVVFRSVYFNIFLVVMVTPKTRGGFARSLAAPHFTERALKITIIA